MANILECFVVMHDSHQTTLIENIEKLRETDSLVDCTLEAEGKYIKAHKVILAASSVFFSNLFNNCRNQGSVFVMRDIAFDELKATVDFIYRGEVIIPRNQLETFLKVVKALQIEGIFGTETFNNNNVPQQNFEKNQNNRQLENSSPEPPELDLHEDSFSCSSPPNGNSFRKGLQSSDLEKELLKERICESDSIKVTHQQEQIILKSELAPPINVTSDSVENMTQLKLESLDIPKDIVVDCLSIENFTETIDAFSKDISNKKDSQSSVLEKRKMGSFCDTDFRDVKKKQLIPVLEITRLNIDTLHKTKNKIQLHSESSGIHHHVKRKRNKKVISDKKCKKSSQIRRYSKNTGPNLCSQCGHTYKMRGSLNSHLKNECGKEPHFECDICKKKTKQKGNLVSHMRIHIHERETKCPKCNKTFKSFQGLYFHSKYVCGKKPKFECDICKQKFVLKRLLVCHVRVHDRKIEKRSYRQCGKICKINQALHYPSKYVCEKKFKFECDICKIRFTKKSRLIRHITRLHNPDH